MMKYMDMMAMIRSTASMRLIGYMEETAMTILSEAAEMIIYSEEPETTE